MSDLTAINDPMRVELGLKPHVPGPPGKPTPNSLLDALSNPKPVPVGEKTTISFQQVPVFDKTPPKVAMTLEECSHVEYVIKFRKLETPQQIVNALGSLDKNSRIEIVFKSVDMNTFTPKVGIAVFQEVDLFLERLAVTPKFHYYFSYETLVDASYAMEKRSRKLLEKLGLLTKKPKKTKTTTK